jgi:DNA (cytosine-5)-methyltransferase 1
MADRPRLLDLFCGAGGCSVGYHRAGFDVVGVDIEPQPNYPYPFIQGDALDVLRRLLAGEGVEASDGRVYYLSDFVGIHASPPCQDYSRAMRHLANPQPRLLHPVRDMLEATGLPWVIENVEGAPIPHSPTLDGRYGVLICGSALGLRIRRHRLFESSFWIPSPGGCDHRSAAMNPHNQRGRDRITAEFGGGDQERPWREAMGVEWMGRYEAREAIPPVYTEHIGGYLMAAVRAMEAAA